MIRNVLLLCVLCGELHATPLIMSHRAGMGHFPQASPAAIQHSIALGIDFIELDLRLSADGVPVVYHDSVIDRQLCAQQDGSALTTELAVADLPLAELKELHCGIRRNPQFPDQIPTPYHILTLQEVLTIVAIYGTDINLMLELKRVRLSKMRSFVRTVLTIIADSGLSARVNLQSANPLIASLLKQIASWRKLPRITDLVAAPANWITPRRVAGLQRLGKRVVGYTVNTPEEWEKLLQEGVDGFITDYPRTLQEFLARRAYEFSSARR